LHDNLLLSRGFFAPQRVKSSHNGLFGYPRPPLIGTYRSRATVGVLIPFTLVDNEDVAAVVSTKPQSTWHKSHISQTRIGIEVGRGRFISRSDV
jgi:hypothetical protein